MPPSASSSSNGTSTTSLALPSSYRRLEALKKDQQWLLKQTKRKRTELNNFVEQMRSLATEIFKQGNPHLKNLTALDQEIHSLFEEIFRTRKFGKKAKKTIEGIYRSLQLGGIISPKFNNQAGETELDELFENQEPEPNFNFKSEENSEPDTEERQEFPPQQVAKTQESRKIRQTFLRLAEIFHPDKVMDSENHLRHTEIMKEINRAYQDGDLARLLEIEQQHQAGESIANETEDEITRSCNRLEQENQFLKNQYENLKRELRLVKKTPEGVMVSDYRKAKREGIDPIAEMMEQMESELHGIEQLRDFIRDFRDKKVTIKEFITGPTAWRQTPEEMMEEMFGDLLEVIRF
ncbi:MAG: J domain-containing protein [Symploca sp. SIO1C2]|nr:J domain-containing protein [Symploca sp. SIO1C2]